MIKNIKSKLLNNKGMSLLEMTCSIALLLIVFAIVVTCILTASETYMKSVTYAEAQTLCATISTAMRDECSFSTTGTVIDKDTNKIKKFGSGIQHVVITEDIFSSEVKDQEGVIYLGDSLLIPSGLYGSYLNGFVDVTYKDGNFEIAITVSNNSGAELASNLVYVRPFVTPTVE